MLLIFDSFLLECNCLTLVSALQWSESAICIHISPPSWSSLLPHPSSHQSRHHRALIWGFGLYSSFLLEIKTQSGPLSRLASFEWQLADVVALKVTKGKSLGTQRESRMLRGLGWAHSSGEFTTEERGNKCTRRGETRLWGEQPIKRKGMSLSDVQEACSPRSTQCQWGIGEGTCVPECEMLWWLPWVCLPTRHPILQDRH